MMLGGVSCFHVERVNILGVLRTVAVVVDVREHTALESVVGIIGNGGQDTEVPACFDLATKRIHFLGFGLALGEQRERHKSH